jgi:hypothetical protein
MDTQFKILAGRFVPCRRQLPIVALVFAVFALGLHAKLALYKPASPTVLLTITKLSAGDRSAKTILPSRKRLVRMKAIVLPAALLFFLTFQHLSGHLRHDRRRGFSLTGLMLRHQYRFLFF